MTRLLLLLVVLAPVAQAQWSWDADLEAGAERADNLFRSPDVLLTDEAVRDSIAVDDVVLPVRATAEVGRDWGRRSLELRYDLALNRYQASGDLDGEDHAVRLTAAAERGRVELEAQARWQEAERVGVHVLGDVRPQLFRYRQPEARARVRWTPAARHRLDLSARAYERGYDSTLDQSDLDHLELSAEATWRVRRRESRRTLWQVEATAGVRDRRYRSLLARDADGVRADANPANRLVYVDGGLRAERSLTSTLAVSAEVGARLRLDPHQDYYTYRGGSVRAGAEWAPHPAVEVALGGRAQRLAYSVQTAPQQDGLDPLLGYTYYGWDASVAVRPLAGVRVTAFTDGRRRLSNVTRETLRFRRSYLTSVVGLRVALDLRRAAFRRN